MLNESSWFESFLVGGIDLGAVGVEVNWLLFDDELKPEQDADEFMDEDDDEIMSSVSGEISSMKLAQVVFDSLVVLVGSSIIMLDGMQWYSFWRLKLSLIRLRVSFF